VGQGRVGRVSSREDMYKNDIIMQAVQVIVLNLFSCRIKCILSYQLCG